MAGATARVRLSQQIDCEELPYDGLRARSFGMAPNVAELYQFNPDIAPRDILDAVTIRTRAEIADAAAALEGEVRGFGLRAMVWHDLATMEPTVDADGQPINCRILGWDAADLAPLIAIDDAVRPPWLRACRVESQPFWFNRRGVHTLWENLYLDAIGLEEFDKRAPMKSAIVVPVHMPFGQTSVAIFTSFDPAQTDLSREFARHSDPLARLAQRFMAGYAKVNRNPRHLPTETMLTARQIECLHWAAQGKTDYEIGIIMGCSHAGVRYHLSRACESLGTVNRAQSVFRACQLGYFG